MFCSCLGTAQNEFVKLANYYMLIINRGEGAEASPVRQHLTLSVVRALEIRDMQGDWSWTPHKVYSHNLECCVTSSSPNNYYRERSVGDHRFQHNYLPVTNIPKNTHDDFWWLSGHTILFASVADSQTPQSVFIPFLSTTLAMHYLAAQDF